MDTLSFKILICLLLLKDTFRDTIVLGDILFIIDIGIIDIVKALHLLMPRFQGSHSGV